MSTEELCKFGILVQQHIFVVSALPLGCPGRRGLPRRLVERCEFIYNIDTDEVIKNRWFEVESEAALKRVVSLYDERISHVSEIQEFLNIPLWP